MAVAGLTGARDTRLAFWQTTLLAIPALATVACLAGIVRFLIWTSGRGLDITDEGYYFVSARHPEDVVMMVTASFRLLRPIFAAVGWNIPAYRVVGFAITVLAAFVFAAGLDACRRRLDPDASRSWTYFFAEAAAIATGSLLGYSWLLSSPSYNWITNWGIAVGAGAVLVTLAIGDTSRAASIWLGILGLALGAVFFAKFTAAVAAGAVFTAVLLAWPLVPFRVRLRWLLAAAAGFVLFVACYFIVFQSPASWLRMFRLGLWDASVHNPLHGAQSSLVRYYVDWRDDVVSQWLKDFSRVFYALTALAVVIRFVPSKGRSGLALRALAWAGLGYAAYVSAIHVRDYPPALYQYDVTRLFFGWLLLLGPLALVWGGFQLPASGSQLPASGSRLPASGFRFAWTMVVLMLFLLPFCGALGTGNPLQYGMRYTIGPWFALLALMLGRLSAPARPRWLVPVGLAVLSGYCAVYLVKGPLEAPYRLLTGLRGQTEDTPIGETSSIVKLDPELHTFITDVRKVAQETGFKSGDDIVGLYDMPGIVYALGGRSPGITWWTMGYSGSPIVMERAVTLAGAERLRRSYILQTKSSTAWLASLRHTGVNFPDDYVLGGTFTIPYSWAKEEVKWWRPKYR